LRSAHSRHGHPRRGDAVAAVHPRGRGIRLHPGLRARDNGRVRSREIILEATRAQIGASGFDGVSIAGVAKRAGVSRQTVYSIFDTREDLVSQTVTDRLTQLIGSFEQLLASSETLL